MASVARPPLFSLGAGGVGWGLSPVGVTSHTDRRSPCYRVGMTTTETAAAIIAKARETHGHGPAAFDWQVAGNTPLATRLIENAAYQIANPDTTPITEVTDGVYAGPSIDRTKALLDSVSAELDAYRERCKKRQYTGWSSGHPSQIRYA